MQEVRAVRRLLGKCLSLKTARLLLELRRYRRRRRRQEDALQDLLVSCAACVPYYRRAFRTVAMSEAIRFADLPIMDKATLRTNFAETIAVWPGGALHGSPPFWLATTSGSTGSSSPVLKGKTDVIANLSTLRAVFRQYRVPRFGHLFDLGVHWPGQPLVEARVVPGAFVCWNFKAYSLDVPLVRKQCLEVLGIARPTVVYGAPSRVVPFAELCRERGTTVRPKLVLTTYEHLSEGAAAYLSETFDCPVVQIYGTAETGPLGWTCRLGRWHFDPRTVAVELVDGEGDYVEPGESGRIVVTPLWDRTMPLIRFDTGDLGRCPEDRCSCGGGGTELDAIEGRASQMLRTRSGRSFSPFAVFGYIADIGVVDWQLVERGRSELELIVAPGVSVPDGAVERLAARVSRYLQEPATVSVRHGDFIRTGNGKRNAFVCLADENATV